MKFGRAVSFVVGPTCRVPGCQSTGRHSPSQRHASPMQQLWSWKEAESIVVVGTNTELKTACEMSCWGCHTLVSVHLCITSAQGELQHCHLVPEDNLTQQQFLLRAHNKNVCG